MKKTIGIIGTAVIAMVMFFNTNMINSSNGDLDLASLLEVNTANAECDGFDVLDAYCYRGDTCVIICNGRQINGSGWSNTP